MVMRRVIQKTIAIAYEWLSRQYKFYCYRKIVDSGHLSMGKHSYGIPLVHLYKGSEAKVKIGKFTSIAPDVTFITGGIHPTNWVSTFPFRSKWKMEGADQDGMPAQVIKKRFAEQVISDLLTLQWWNWEDEYILRNVEYLSSPNVDEFIKWHITDD